MTDSATLTVLDDEAVTVDGRVDGGRVLVAGAALTAATGWSLRPEGLCRGDVCVPVRDADDLEPVPGEIDLVVLARLLDRPVVVDPEARIVCFGAPRQVRRGALAGGPMPEVSLVDVHGAPRSLGPDTDAKQVVVAFATWCGCREDLPGWQALADELGEQVRIVAVALDEDPADVRPFADAVDLEVLVDRDHLLADRLGISNVPAVVWVDERGRVARPPTVAFGTDTWRDFHGVAADPHLDAVRRWVATDEVPDGSANEAAGGVGAQVGELSDDEEQARLWFRIGAHLLRQGDQAAAAPRFARATELAPLDFTVARAAMPLTGRDPFGADFLDLYERWRQAGSPFHGLDPDA